MQRFCVLMKMVVASKPTHGIAFYYLTSFADGNDIPITGEFVLQKDNCNVVLGWLPLDELKI